MIKKGDRVYSITDKGYVIKGTYLFSSKGVARVSIKTGLFHPSHIWVYIDDLELKPIIRVYGY